MKVALLGDVGRPGSYHVGDEAMFDSAVRHLRQAGVTAITGIGHAPDLIASAYAVDAVGGFRFASGRDARAATRRERRLEEIIAAGPDAGLWAEPDMAGGAAEAIREADALIIAGGGNLCSSWPDLVYERIAALRIADERGIPAVLSGQTLGPILSQRDRQLLAGTGICMLGLREKASLALAAGVFPDVPRRLQLDDSTDLPGEAGQPFEGQDRLAAGFVAVTVHTVERLVADPTLMDAMARFLRDVCRISGLPVAFVPHLGGSAVRDGGDVGIGSRLRDVLGEDLFVLCPLLPARQALALTRQASAVVSTRYHPLVFGLSAGVPCLAMYEDHYTETKMAGTLAHAGMQEWRIPVDAVSTELPTRLFDRMWSSRDGIAAHLQRVTSDWPTRAEEHWQEVVMAISDPATIVHLTGPPHLPDVTGPSPGMSDVDAVNQLITRQFALNSAVEMTHTTSFAEAEEYALDLEMHLTERDKELASLRRHLDRVDQDLREATVMLGEKWARADELEVRLAEADRLRAAAAAEAARLAEEVDHAHASAGAARSLVGEMNTLLDEIHRSRKDLEAELAHDRSELAALQSARSELEALHATKTVRWLRPFRQAYGRVKVRLRL